MKTQLFLIGNGFDLAHGIPTSYNDLVKWYGQELINKLREVKTVHDDFFETSLSIPLGGGVYSIRDCPSSFSKLLDLGYAKSKSDFFIELLKYYRKGNWVDIESFYFEKLKKIAEIPKGKINPDERLKRVKNLNQQFQNIQDLLSRYLDTLNDKITLIPEFIEMFKPKSTEDRHLFLTFNYTNTMDVYFEHLKYSKNSEVVNIHGRLNSENSPMIFGYGDQHDKAYHTLENFNQNEFLEYIKYPKYTLSDGFQQLARFINVPNRTYHVNIIGHSCGLSDRTLLREVLENPNCERIFIHHYPDRKDFTRKATELTRHFSDKISYLKKTQPFNSSLRCPQINKTTA
ncbi:MAG: hypothetical protein ACI8TA_003121 [Cyclobacteriaceae bacterium]|jgi:hypothetical protein